MKRGISYLIILGMVFLYHALSLKILSFLIPLSMYLFPILFRAVEQQGSRAVVFRRKNIYSKISCYSAALLLCCSVFVYPSTYMLLYQFFGVALPEEFYFRGFLQDELGNNLRVVIFVSILFSFMHLPRLIFYSDLLSIMTFFPSLVMGYLYLKTGNILASTVFHFLANTAFYLLGYRL